jgi:hypothetical protein
MNPKFDPKQIGEQLGREGIGSMVTSIEEYCTHEVRRIQLVNEARIVALHAESALLLEEEKSLKEQLRHAPRPMMERGRIGRRVYAWVVVVVLALAGFIFSVVALDPFRLGRKAYPYCLGMAIVTVFLIDLVLEKFDSEKLVKSIAAIACACALGSMVLLAVIRGDILAQELSVVRAVVILDEDTPAPPQNDFYEKTLPLLQIVMGLLAVAMDLGAGLALKEAWRMDADSGKNWEHLQQRLMIVRRRMLALTEEAIALRNEPAIFAASFWRNFQHSMITQAKRSAMKKLLLLVAFGCVAVPSARAEERATIIVAVDLSQSVKGEGPDRKSDFQKNVAAVSRFLGTVPPSSRVVVVGITDKSFAEPYILLSGRVTDDAGHFGERLAAARAQLIQQWKRRSAELKPQFECTDILGMLFVAERLFAESPKDRHLLVIFSDMRHHTLDLDLESPALVPRFSTVRKHSQVSSARLENAEVYIAGVDNAGKTIAYWQSLRAFWSDYFQSAGARLQGYSALRELSGTLQDALTPPKAGSVTRP